MVPFVNIHTHRKPFQREWAVRNAWLNEKLNMPQQAGYFTSIGIHPWFADKIESHEIDWRMSILVNNESVKAIGEIGIDRVNGPAFHIQEKIFEIQLQLAKKYNKPVIIHCVKAYSDLQVYLKKYDMPFVLHDYNGNEQTTEQLLRFEQVYFSFGKLLFRNSENAKNRLQQIPSNRLFFETDTMNIPIQKVYDMASELLPVSSEDLAKICFDNFIKIM